MAKYSKVTVNVPDIKSAFVYGNGISYSDASVKKANTEMIRRINSQYGNLFTEWGNVFEIPKGILIGFCATESGGKMMPPNRYEATGLMQVTPIAIYECARKWNKEVSSELPFDAESLINQKVPTLLKSSTTLSSVKSRLLNVLQNDANFNIMAGALVLRWLIERFSTFLTGGQLNKAMVAYNAGAYTRSLVTSGSKANKIPIDSTSLSQNALVPAESRSYLVKMLGVDGFLSIIYKDKAI